MKDQLKNILASVAPALSTALGNPLAGVALAMLAKKYLGDENAKQSEVFGAVQAAVVKAQSDPMELSKLKELDKNFILEMRRLGVKDRELGLADVSDARNRDELVRFKLGSNPRADFLAVAVIGMSVLLLVLLFNSDVSGWQRDAFLLILGSWLTMTKDVYQFEFGSSRGSKDKSAELDKRR